MTFTRFLAVVVNGVVDAVALSSLAFWTFALFYASDGGPESCVQTPEYHVWAGTILAQSMFWSAVVGCFIAVMRGVAIAAYARDRQ